MLSSRAFSEKI